MLGDSNNIIPVLQREAPPFHDDAPAAVLQPPIIVTPDNRAAATRMPPPRGRWSRGNIPMRLSPWSNGSLAKARAKGWEGSGFLFVPPNDDTYLD